MLRIWRSSMQKPASTGWCTRHLVALASPGDVVIWSPGSDVLAFRER